MLEADKHSIPKAAALPTHSFHPHSQAVQAKAQMAELLLAVGRQHSLAQVQPRGTKINDQGNLETET